MTLEVRGVLASKEKCWALVHSLASVPSLITFDGFIHTEGDGRCPAVNPLYHPPTHACNYCAIAPSSCGEPVLDLGLLHDSLFLEGRTAQYYVTWSNLRKSFDYTFIYMMLKRKTLTPSTLLSIYCQSLEWFLSPEIFSWYMQWRLNWNAQGFICIGE